MPKLVLAIPEMQDSVTRPVVYDVLRQLRVMTELPLDAPILFPGMSEALAQPDSTITKPEERIRSNYETMYTLTVDEHFKDENVLATAVIEAEFIPFFSDEKLQIVMKPSMAQMEVDLNISFQASNKTEALRWRDLIKTKISQLREYFLMDVTYYYLLPPAAVVIMEELHRMREAVEGYGQTFDEYMRSHASIRLTKVTTQSGNVEAWAISEMQRRVQGWLEVDAAPEQGNLSGDASAWTIGFTYKFVYDKPTAVVFTYPLMVHNQLLAQKYRPKMARPRTDIYTRGMTHSHHQMSIMNSQQKQVLYSQAAGYSIPEFDEFIPARVPMYSQRLVTALLKMSTTDPLLMNLGKLPGYHIHPKVLAFMRGEAPYMAKFNQSVMCVTFYRGRDPVEASSITIDEELNIRRTNEQSLRDEYHIRLGVHTHWNFLDRDAIRRLCNHGEAARIIIGCINPRLKWENKLPPIVQDDYIPPVEMEKVIDEMIKDIISARGKPLTPMRTVEILSIHGSPAENMGQPTPPPMASVKLP